MLKLSKTLQNVTFAEEIAFLKFSILFGRSIAARFNHTNPELKMQSENCFYCLRDLVKVNSYWYEVMIEMEWMEHFDNGYAIQIDTILNIYDVYATERHELFKSKLQDKRMEIRNMKSNELSIIKNIQTVMDTGSRYLLIFPIKTIGGLCLLMGTQDNHSKYFPTTGDIVQRLQSTGFNHLISNFINNFVASDDLNNGLTNIKDQLSVVKQKQRQYINKFIFDRNKRIEHSFFHRWLRQKMQNKLENAINSNNLFLSIVTDLISFSHFSESVDQTSTKTNDSSRYLNEMLIQCSRLFQLDSISVIDYAKWEKVGLKIKLKNEKLFVIEDEMNSDVLYGIMHVNVPVENENFEEIKLSSPDGFFDQKTDHAVLSIIQIKRKSQVDNSHSSKFIDDNGTKLSRQWLFNPQEIILFKEFMSISCSIYNALQIGLHNPANENKYLRWLVTCLNDALPTLLDEDIQFHRSLDDVKHSMQTPQMAFHLISEQMKRIADAELVLIKIDNKYMNGVPSHRSKALPSSAAGTVHDYFKLTKRFQEGVSSEKLNDQIQSYHLYQGTGIVNETHDTKIGQVDIYFSRKSMDELQIMTLEQELATEILAYLLKFSIVYYSTLLQKNERIEEDQLTIHQQSDHLTSMQSQLLTLNNDLSECQATLNLLKTFQFVGNELVLTDSLQDLSRVFCEQLGSLYKADNLLLFIRTDVLKHFHEFTVDESNASSDIAYHLLDGHTTVRSAVLLEQIAMQFPLRDPNHNKSTLQSRDSSPLRSKHSQYYLLSSELQVIKDIHKSNERSQIYKQALTDGDMHPIGFLIFINNNDLVEGTYNPLDETTGSLIDLYCKFFTLKCSHLQFQRTVEYLSSNITSLEGDLEEKQSIENDLQIQREQNAQILEEKSFLLKQVEQLSMHIEDVTKEKEESLHRLQRILENLKHSESEEITSLKKEVLQQFEHIESYEKQANSEKVFHNTIEKLINSYTFDPRCRTELILEWLQEWCTLFNLCETMLVISRNENGITNGDQYKIKGLNQAINEAFRSNETIQFKTTYNKYLYSSGSNVARNRDGPIGNDEVLLLIIPNPFISLNESSKYSCLVFIRHNDRIRTHSDDSQKESISHFYEEILQFASKLTFYTLKKNEIKYSPEDFQELNSKLQSTELEMIRIRRIILWGQNLKDNPPKNKHDAAKLLEVAIIDLLQSSGNSALDVNCQTFLLHSDWKDFIAHHPIIGQKIISSLQPVRDSTTLWFPVVLSTSRIDSGTYQGSSGGAIEMIFKIERTFSATSLDNHQRFSKQDTFNSMQIVNVSDLSIPTSDEFLINLHIQFVIPFLDKFELIVNTHNGMQQASKALLSLQNVNLSLEDRLGTEIANRLQLEQTWQLCVELIKNTSSNRITLVQLIQEIKQIIIQAISATDCYIIWSAGALSVIGIDNNNQSIRSTSSEESLFFILKEETSNFEQVPLVDNDTESLAMRNASLIAAPAVNQTSRMKDKKPNFSFTSVANSWQSWLVRRLESDAKAGSEEFFSISVPIKLTNQRTVVITTARRSRPLTFHDVSIAHSMGRMLSSCIDILMNFKMDNEVELNNKKIEDQIFLLQQKEDQLHSIQNDLEDFEKNLSSSSLIYPDEKFCKMDGEDSSSVDQSSPTTTTALVSMIFGVSSTLRNIRYETNHDVLSSSRELNLTQYSVTTPEGWMVGSIYPTNDNKCKEFKMLINVKDKSLKELELIIPVLAPEVLRIKMSLFLKFFILECDRKVHLFSIQDGVLTIQSQHEAEKSKFINDIAELKTSHLMQMNKLHEDLQKSEYLVIHLDNETQMVCKLVNESFQIHNLVNHHVAKLLVHDQKQSQLEILEFIHSSTMRLISMVSSVIGLNLWSGYISDINSSSQLVASIKTSSSIKIDAIHWLDDSNQWKISQKYSDVLKTAIETNKIVLSRNLADRGDVNRSEPLGGLPNSNSDELNWQDDLIICNTVESNPSIIFTVELPHLQCIYVAIIELSEDQKSDLHKHRSKLLHCLVTCLQSLRTNVRLNIENLEREINFLELQRVMKLNQIVVNQLSNQQLISSQNECKILAFTKWRAVTMNAKMKQMNLVVNKVAHYQNRVMVMEKTCADWTEIVKGLNGSIEVSKLASGISGLWYHASKVLMSLISSHVVVKGCGLFVESEKSDIVEYTVHEWSTPNGKTPKKNKINLSEITHTDGAVEMNNNVKQQYNSSIFNLLKDIFEGKVGLHHVYKLNRTNSQSPPQTVRFNTQMSESINLQSIEQLWLVPILSARSVVVGVLRAHVQINSNPNEHSGLMFKSPGRNVGYNTESSDSMESAEKIFVNFATIVSPLLSAAETCKTIYGKAIESKEIELRSVERVSYYESKWLQLSELVAIEAKTHSKIMQEVMNHLSKVSMDISSTDENQTDSDYVKHLILCISDSLSKVLKQDVSIFIEWLPLRQDLNFDAREVKLKFDLKYTNANGGIEAGKDLVKIKEKLYDKTGKAFGSIKFQRSVHEDKAVDLEIQNIIDMKIPWNLQQVATFVSHLILTKWEENQLQVNASFLRNEMELLQQSKIIQENRLIVLQSKHDELDNVTTKCKNLLSIQTLFMEYISDEVNDMNNSTFMVSNEEIEDNLWKFLKEVCNRLSKVMEPLHSAIYFAIIKQDDNPLEGVDELESENTTPNPVEQPAVEQPQLVWIQLDPVDEIERELGSIDLLRNDNGTRDIVVNLAQVCIGKRKESTFIIGLPTDDSVDNKMPSTTSYRIVTYPIMQQPTKEEKNLSNEYIPLGTMQLVVNLDQVGPENISKLEENCLEIIPWMSTILIDTFKKRSIRNNLNKLEVQNVLLESKYTECKQHRNLWRPRSLISSGFFHIMETVMRSETTLDNVIDVLTSDGLTTKILSYGFTLSILSDELSITAEDLATSNMNNISFVINIPTKDSNFKKTVSLIVSLNLEIYKVDTDESLAWIYDMMKTAEVIMKELIHQLVQQHQNWLELQRQHNQLNESMQQIQDAKNEYNLKLLCETDMNTNHLKEIDKVRDTFEDQLASFMNNRSIQEQLIREDCRELLMQEFMKPPERPQNPMEIMNMAGDGLIENFLKGIHRMLDKLMSRSMDPLRSDYKGSVQFNISLVTPLSRNPSGSDQVETRYRVHDLSSMLQFTHDVHTIPINQNPSIHIDADFGRISGLEESLLYMKQVVLLQDKISTNDLLGISPTLQNHLIKIIKEKISKPKIQIFYFPFYIYMRDGEKKQTLNHANSVMRLVVMDLNPMESTEKDLFSLNLESWMTRMVSQFELMMSWHYHHNQTLWDRGVEFEELQSILTNQFLKEDGIHQQLNQSNNLLERVNKLQKLVTRQSILFLDPPQMQIAEGNTSSKTDHQFDHLIHPASLTPLAASQDVCLKSLQMIRTLLQSDGQALILKDSNSQPVSYQIIYTGNNLKWNGIEPGSFGIITPSNYIHKPYHSTLQSAARKEHLRYNSLLEFVLSEKKGLNLIDMKSDNRYNEFIDGICSSKLKTSLISIPLYGRSGVVVGVFMISRNSKEFQLEEVMAAELCSVYVSLNLYWCQGLGILHQQLIHHHRKIDRLEKKIQNQHKNEN